MLIIAALFAVLLSAFGAERYHACHGDQHCLKQTTASWLPAGRFILGRQEVQEVREDRERDRLSRPDRVAPAP